MGFERPSSSISPRAPQQWKQGIRHLFQPQSGCHLELFYQWRFKARCFTSPKTCAHVASKNLLDSSRFFFRQIIWTRTMNLFFLAKAMAKGKDKLPERARKSPSYLPSDTKMDDSKICQFGWLQPSINSWAELPPRGQHALCSSGGASQGTPGQMHDLHQLQLKSCTAISGVTHVFCHSQDVLVWMHTIEMGVHLIDTNSMVEFNLPLGSDQWHQNFGRTRAPHQAQIPSLQKIARKDQRQEKDKSREAVCILFIKRKYVGNESNSSNSGLLLDIL